MKMQTADREARNRILRAAAEHFGMNGYHGSSVREITNQARVNLAAINYHFRSKESLYCEVLSLGLRPLNQIRLQKLNHAAELAGDGPIPLELVIKIFAEPLFALCGNSPSSKNFPARLIGRSLSEPLPFAQEFIAKEQRVFSTRFAQAIRRHAPRMGASEFMWRFIFVVGALHHTLATMHCMSDLTHGLCRNTDIEQTTAHFVHFAVNTIQAPPTPS